MATTAHAPGTPARWAPAVPPLGVAGGLALGAVVLRLVAPLPTMLPDPWWLLGVAPMVVASFVATWSERELRRHGTQAAPGGRVRRLVEGGPYRRSRNPMYLAALLALAGFGTVLNSPVTALGLPVAWVALADRLFVDVEERLLARSFPDAYPRYAARVRRWL